MTSHVYILTTDMGLYPEFMSAFKYYNQAGRAAGMFVDQLVAWDRY